MGSIDSTGSTMIALAFIAGALVVGALAVLCGFRVHVSFRKIEQTCSRCAANEYRKNHEDIHQDNHEEGGTYPMSGERDTYNPAQWAGAFNYVDLRTEDARRRIVEAAENLRLMVAWFVDSADAPSEPPREVGGIERSYEQLSALFGAKVDRYYYDDGCTIEREMSREEVEAGGEEWEAGPWYVGGHDGEAGCEEREDGDGVEDGSGEKES
jgi:hypothetical protein